jgi:hypothetical protein
VQVPGKVCTWQDHALASRPYSSGNCCFRGDATAIEYRDSNESRRFAVTTRQVDWDEPTDLVHRGVHTGEEPYEEITIFFLNHLEDVPQPREELQITSKMWRGD